MKTNIILTALIMATLTLSAQTSDNDFILTQKDFGLAAISKDIKSTSINGQTYYYTIVKDKPNLAVIVAKKTFEKCSSIKKVDLPKTVRYIGNEAFCNADVDDLSLKEGLIKIGNKAFLNNDLKDIHIPDGVEEIGELAFYCYKSTIFQRAGGGTLYIPKSVYSICDKAFAMTRNGYGAWFNSKRKILCLPDHVTLDNCKKMGISREPVEEYLKGK